MNICVGGVYVDVSKKDLGGAGREVAPVVKSPVNIRV